MRNDEYRSSISIDGIARKRCRYCVFIELQLRDRRMPVLAFRNLDGFWFCFTDLLGRNREICLEKKSNRSKKRIKSTDLMIELGSVRRIHSRNIFGPPDVETVLHDRIEFDVRNCVASLRNGRHGQCQLLRGSLGGGARDHRFRRSPRAFHCQNGGRPCLRNPFCVFMTTTRERFCDMTSTEIAPKCPTTYNRTHVLTRSPCRRYVTECSPINCLLESFIRVS